MTISAPSSHGDPFDGSETDCLEVSYSCNTFRNFTMKKTRKSTNLYGTHAIFKTKIIRWESCYVKLPEGRIWILFPRGVAILLSMVDEFAQMWCSGICVLDCS